MNSMRSHGALIAAKAAGQLSRLAGRGSGSALPGLIADKIDPNLAKNLAAQLPNGCIVVTGTNGKTTVTKLLVDILESSGEKVLSNRAGSNLKRGIISSLVAHSSIRGSIDATIGLFEVDEASLRILAPLLKPRHIVVTNLFRDQLDRYGELDSTAALIGEGIAATSAQLYLNADDPLVASLSKYAAKPEQVVYFGIEGLSAELATGDRSAVDSDRCPVCGERLVFSRVFYAHIGHYSCPNNNFNRPKPNIAVTHVSNPSRDGQQFEVSFSGKRLAVSTLLPGLYNIYNALAALAVASGASVPPAQAVTAIAATEAAFGRVEKIKFRDRDIVLILIKNPIGFSQVIETFLAGQPQLAVAFIINDLHADGRDVSWLWDVSLDGLAGEHTVAVTGGMRATDMALRLKYASIGSRVAPTPLKAVEWLSAALTDGQTGYVLATYTAMLDLRGQISQDNALPKVSS